MAIFRNKKIIIFFVLLVAAVIYWNSANESSTKQEQYRMGTVKRSDIIQTISANGTLSPVILVDVGTQVSGTVSKLYVNFNDQVEVGQVLAELDPALLQAQLQQSEASLLNAQVAMEMAASKLRRNRMLKEKGFISSEAEDIVELELNAAQAQLVVSQAQVARDRANLEYSVIKSPISGVVIARDVDIGQTVAANFQTPVLFQIAQDLSQMQINISVAEADIGQLHEGQEINFTVDAYMDRHFSGTVNQIRLNPTIVENVVTYNVIAVVNNDDGVLLPGMTANTSFIINQKPAVLAVPNAALRYKPKPPDAPEGRGGSGSPHGKPVIAGLSTPVVYQLENGQPKKIPVTIGISDGNITEISDGSLTAGDQLIVGEIKDKGASGQSGRSSARFRMF